MLDNSYSAREWCKSDLLKQHFCYKNCSTFRHEELDVLEFF